MPISSVDFVVLIMIHVAPKEVSFRRCESPETAFGVVVPVPARFLARLGSPRLSCCSGAALDPTKRSRARYHRRGHAAMHQWNRPIVRSGMAWLSLLAMLGSQCVLPMATAYAESAAVVRVSGVTSATATTGGNQTGNGVRGNQSPAIQTLGRVLGFQQSELADRQTPLKRGIKASSPLACEECKVSLRALDLKRTPSEKELRQAGQLGGALSPIGSADVTLLRADYAQYLQSAVAQAQLKEITEARAKQYEKQIKRLEDINLSFGNAIQQWNKHHFREAAAMFKEHLKAYPDSPWAGEAVLHLGCDAKYNGRFAEAQAIFSQLFQETGSSGNSNATGTSEGQRGATSPSRVVGKNTAGNKAPENKIADGNNGTVLNLRALNRAAFERGNYEIHQKAKLRWADLDIAMGRLDDAHSKLRDILSTENDWRRKTWALHWLRQVGLYKQNARDLRACGTEALSVLLASLGKTEAARKVEQLRPKNKNGFSLGELQRLARRYDVELHGFRADIEQLDQLPTPFLVHYDFANGAPNHPQKVDGIGSEQARNDSITLPDFLTEGDSAPSAAKSEQQATQGQQDAGRQTPALSDKKQKNKQSPHDKIGSPYIIHEQAGHFLLVQKVDAGQRRVKLYDPQEKRYYSLSYQEMKREWSGTGLSLAAKVPARVASRQADSQTAGYAGSHRNERQIAWLPSSALNRVFGGCCGVARLAFGLGASMVNSIINGPCGGGKGSPVFSVNRVNLNLFIHDTPLWYSTDVGPDVEFTMNYNSQDALSQRPLLGNKWVLNYGSYLVEDTADNGGQVVVFMPDGAQHKFTPNGSGSYTDQAGVYDQLRKLSPTRYELTSPTGEQFIYDIPPGTDSLQPLLLEIRDRWGYAVKFTYAVSGSDVLLTTITDAQGRQSVLTYDAAGHITRVTDPFGRHATFAYDSSGNMVEVVDMEGNSFQYAYDDRVEVTQVNTAQGPWQFRYEYPYRGVHGTDSPWFWAQMYLTITNPKGEAELYAWDGAELGGDNRQPSYHVDARGVRTNYWMDTVVDGQALITSIDQDVKTVNGQMVPTQTSYIGYDQFTGLPLSFTDPGGRTTTLTRNAVGLATSIRRPKGNVTRFNYDPVNSIDLLSIVDPQAHTIAAFTYNSKHQVLSTTDAFSKTTTKTYTAWGAPQTVTDDDGHVTTYTYDSTNDNDPTLASGTKRLLSISQSGSTIGTFTYDTIGHVRTSTNAGGQTVTYDYNDLNQVTKITYPDNSFIGITYACCGLPGMVQDRAGRKTFCDYDELQRLIRVQDTAGNSANMAYDDRGNLAKLIDTRGTATNFYYDNLNRIQSKTFVDGSSESWSYDVAGNSVARRDTQGRITRTYLDLNGNPVRLDSPSSADVTFGYDALDRIVRMVDGQGTTNYAYDTRGQLLSEDGPYANDTVSYTYDDLGRRATMQVNGADQVTYNYDTLGRLDTLVAPSGTFDPVYVGNTAMLDRLNLPNGSKAIYGYDSPLQRLTSVQNQTGTGSNISNYNYAYEAVGYQKRDLRTSVQQQVQSDALQTINYSYDNSGQLMGEAFSTATTSTSNSYTYDVMGNRTQANIQTGGPDASSTTLNANLLNQVTSYNFTAPGGNGGASCSYDTSGNMRDIVLDMGQGPVTTDSYTYDDNNRLTQIIKCNSITGVNTTRSVFSYDGIGRKRRNTEYSWNPTNSSWTETKDTFFLYDGMNVVQERDANTVTGGINTPQVNYVWAGNIGGLLSRTVKAGQLNNTGATDLAYYYHYDGAGNVVQMTDAAQQVVARYAYDAYGRTLEASGSQANDNPYRYSTKAYHAVSGLYDYGLRFYSPGLGRWINRDPIGTFGGLNIYQFVANSPTNGVDAYGLCMGRFLGSLVGGIIGGMIGGVPGMALGTAAGSFVGSLFDGYSASEAAVNGVQDGVVALALGAAFEGAAAWKAMGRVGEAMGGDITEGVGEALARDLGEVAKEGCFVAGTPVTMADGSSKPIEQVKEGEEVLSRDEATGKTSTKRVEKTFRRTADETLVLHFENGSIVEATTEHPFYVEGKGFVAAKALSVGTCIVTRAGPPAKLARVIRRHQTVTVYNFEVADFHTYFVGTAGGGCLVHNVCYVDPAELRLPPERADGADPFKLADQIREFGDSIHDMPPVWATKGANGEMMINNGVTRATRAAMLRPGSKIPVEIIDVQPGVDLSGLPTIGDSF